MKKKIKLVFTKEPEHHWYGSCSCTVGPFFLCANFKPEDKPENREAEAEAPKYPAVTLLRIRKDSCDNYTDTILWLKERLVTGTREYPVASVTDADIWTALFEHDHNIATVMLREALEESERHNRLVGLDVWNRALREASKLVEAEKHNFRG